MKIRNLLAVVAMLSVFIAGIGTAHAVWGINDDVPMQDLVIPLICEKNGQLDTLFAIADKNEAACHYQDSDAVTSAAVYIYNYKSQFLRDDAYLWTKHDVVTDDCSRLMTVVVGDAALLATAEVTTNGHTYYVGYAIISQLLGGSVPFPGFTDADCFPDPSNRFIAWEYLVDLTKGFASGFNVPGAEDGMGTANTTYMGELGDSVAITAHSFYPRFYFLNDKAETWNWWIYLMGRNELAVENVITYSGVHRKLTGTICDEAEHCYSGNIAIPYELNVINVLPTIPALIKSLNNFPLNPAGMGGFAMFDIKEGGSVSTFPPFTVSITGTANGPFLGDPVPFYSAHAYSYQREQSNDGLPNLSWDVIHPQHRVWCSVSDPINGLDCPVSAGP